MSAIGLPSKSSDAAMRLMSGTDRAPRNASKNRSDSRLSPANSISLVISSVQERTEHKASPRITAFTTQVAPMNIVIGVSLLAPPDALAAIELAASGVLAAGAAEADESAAAAAAGAPESAGAADCAKAGAATTRDSAPIRAMKGVFSLLWDICRQFLLGLTR